MPLKREDWHSRPRLERLANLMYPHLSDASTQKEVLGLAANEGKQRGLQRRIADGQQSYGIKPAEPRSGRVPNVPMTTENLGRVPGLVRRK
jgi:hypothetical protein